MKTLLKNSRMYPYLAPTYRGIKQILSAPQILTNIIFPKTIALLYHRVTTLKEDPYELAVSQKHFEDHILFLKEHFSLLSLKDIYENIKNKKTCHRGILLTFDDGYLDNYTNAFPILIKYNIPGVLFVSGDQDDMTEFWWDEMAYIFSRKESLPDQFSIVINDVQFTFHARTQDDLEKTRNHLYSLLKPLSYSHRENILQQIYDISQRKRIIRREYARCGKDELTTMVNSGLISIGGHTAHHCQLSSLTSEEQEDEISENYQFLTAIKELKNNVMAFAYPYGTKNDYSSETVKNVKKYYALAFSNFRGHIHAHTNIYEIPRFVVKNWTQDEFAKKIQLFFTHGILPNHIL